MKHSMDLGMFRQGNHSPSYATLARSMGSGAEELSDFCIPCNPYFPTPDMFAELSAKLETILKYYPTDAGAITGQLASLLQMPPQTIAMGSAPAAALSNDSFHAVPSKYRSLNRCTFVATSSNSPLVLGSAGAILNT